MRHVLMKKESGPDRLEQITIVEVIRSDFENAADSKLFLHLPQQQQR